MAVELSHNKKDNRPEGEGWEWSNYGECWRKFYDGRKRKKTIPKGIPINKITKKNPVKKKTTKKVNTKSDVILIKVGIWIGVFIYIGYLIFG